MKNVKAKTNEQIAMQVSANSIAVNLMLSIFKLIAGLMAKGENIGYETDYPIYGNLRCHSLSI